MPKPSWKQRLLADDKLPLIWTLLPTVGLMIWAVGSLELTRESLREPQVLGLTLAILGLTLVLGFMGSLFIALITLLPLLLAQGQQNGGPFSVGDRVMILSGTYAGAVTTVYATWQSNRYRVQLGREASEQLADIFDDYKLLRCDPPARAEANTRGVV